MKEKEIIFNRNDDPTLFIMDEVTTKKFTKAFNDLRFGCGTLLDQVKANSLTIGYKDTLASCIENYALELCNSIGYQGVIAREKEERYKEIREANQMTRELRKQLGQKVTPEDCRECLKNLSDNFKRWWNINGFGHCSEESFYGYGFKAKLSGMITEAYYDKKDPDADEDKKIAYLKNLGFLIKQGNSRSDTKVLYIDHNMQLVKDLIKAKYPSAEFMLTTAWHGRHGESEIRDIEVLIRNFDELGKS